jgi:hypothetical protein
MDNIKAKQLGDVASAKSARSSAAPVTAKILRELHCSSARRFYVFI